MVVTEGTLLGGRVRYAQPASGFRSGLEPVLLAACIPARPGERVLEAGTGAGAAALCLSARVDGVQVTAVEIDPDMATLASANAVANGFHGIEVLCGPIQTVPLPGGFDHALANPPYHAPDGSKSPVAAREMAKRGSDSATSEWIGRLSEALRYRGTLSLVVPAAMIPACLAEMSAARCPCSVVFPLWPKVGRAAKLVLLRGIKDSRAPLRLMAGLVLHTQDGSFTEPAQAILQSPTALNLDGHISSAFG
ncbi:MAG TPA: methyltransferase [Rhodopila sp.]|nr:methyltransferase [Rhodopila sp.]